MYRPSPKELKGVLQAAFVVIVAIIMGVLVGRYLKITNATTAPEPTSVAVEGARVAGEMVGAAIRYLQGQSFEDVPRSHWAYEEIELIFSHGVTVGCSYDPPLYCPDRPATRAEMAVMLSRILEIIELGGE